MRILVFVLFLLGLLVGPVSGCGPNARQRTVHATFVTTDAAHASFVAYDAQRQAAIVAQATSEIEGRTALDAYRARRARIVDLFEGTYRAIAVAALLEDDPKNLAQLSQAAALLVDALRDLTGGKLP